MATRAHIHGTPVFAASGPCVRDPKLRDEGFRIVSRPRGGPAVWVKGGRLYTQQQAERAAALDEIDQQKT